MERWIDVNILIIGNGFDIAHCLQTTYTDFLNFVEQVLRIEIFFGSVNEFESKNEKTGYDKFNQLDESVKKYLHSKIWSDKNPDASVKDVFETKNDKIMNEIISLAKDNSWIKWFQNQKEISGNNWIDFESEISEVVQCMELVYKKVIDFNKANHSIDLTSSENKVINNFRTKKSPAEKSFDISECKEKMLNDLNDLIRCLELYLEDCVRNIDKQLLTLDIYDLNIDKVISFNYTDTYNKIYSGLHSFVEYDYIHGKSKISADPANNMVLGIDEYLS